MRSCLSHLADEDGIAIDGRSIALSNKRASYNMPYEAKGPFTGCCYRCSVKRHDRQANRGEKMAVGTITRFSEGMGADQYDAVIGKVGLADEPVEGLIFHSAGELEGRFQVFNVWETREDFDRFVVERLRPAQVAVMGEERVAALPDADIVDVAIHNYVIP